MKILLIGEYYSSNMGDPLLCRTVEKTIQEAFPDAQILPFDISGQTDYLSSYVVEHPSHMQRMFYRVSHRLPALGDMSCLFRVLKEDAGRFFPAMSMLDELLNKHTFNLAIFAGGSLFMSYFSARIYGTVRRLNKSGIPVMFHACGMSHLAKDAATLLRKALRSGNVQSVSLRDSYEKFTSMFRLNARVTETYDTALACSAYFPGNSEKHAEIGIGIIGNPTYGTFQKEVVLRISQWTDSWKIFTNGSPADEKMAYKILEELDIPDSARRNRIVSTPTNAEELVFTVTGFHRIVSFRMHSQIVAASFGIPSYGFVWDDKVKQFYDKLSLSNHYSLPSDDISLERIKHALHRDRQEIRDAALFAGKSSQKSLIEEIKRITQIRRAK